MLKSRICVHINIFLDSISPDHISLPLLLWNKVNIAILSSFPGVYCQTKLIICLIHEVVSM